MNDTNNIYNNVSGVEKGEKSELDIPIDDEKSTNIKPTPAVKIVLSTKQSPKHKSTKLSHVFMMNGVSLIPKHFFVPAHYIIDSKHRHIHREYDLNIFQRIFVAVERPKSSKISLLIATIVNVCIFLGVFCYVIANDQDYYHEYDHCYHHACYNDPKFCPKKKYPHGRCEPTPDHVLHYIEDIILFIFTAEYLVRVLLIPFVPARIANLIPEDHDKSEEEMHLQEPDPVYTWWYQSFIYIIQWKCLIDLATIVPFYVFYGATEGSTSFNFIRVLRLSRILHIFKLTKENEILNLLERTMWLSAPALALVSFVSGLGMVLIGSIMYYLEGGHFEYTDEYPDGHWFRKNPLTEQHEISPFVSIAASMYFTISVATGCAMGDLYPYTATGRAVTNLTQIIGIIIIAIPIGVIGSNFSHEYDAMHHTFKKHAGLLKEEENHKIEPVIEGVGTESSSKEITVPIIAPTNQSSNKIVPLNAEINEVKEKVKFKIKSLNAKLNALQDEIKSLSTFIEADI